MKDKCTKKKIKAYDNQMQILKIRNFSYEISIHVFSHSHIVDSFAHGKGNSHAYEDENVTWYTYSRRQKSKIHAKSLKKKKKNMIL